MIKFEEETGKRAIWDGKITEQFKKWQKGEKVYQKYSDEVRWTTYIKSELNDQWNKFRKTQKYKKSEIIKDSMNYYINQMLIAENHGKIYDFKALNKVTQEALNYYLDETKASETEISNDLKQSLTPLKAFIELLIDLMKKSDETEALKFLMDAKRNCVELEEKIINYFDKTPITKKLIEPKYDILYVEDNESTLIAVKAYVERKGFSIKGINTAEEALEELKFQRPKVILMDLGLKGKIQGDFLLKKLKSKEELKNTHFVIITAKSSEIIEKIKQETKVSEVIKKPFDFSDLDILFKYLA